MRRALLMALLAWAPAAAAQGVRYDNIVLGPRGTPVGGASVAVCTAAAQRSQTPCAPLATVYADAALTQPLANPLTADALGNFGFWAPPGHYVVQIYGPGLAPRTLDVFLPCDPSGTCTMASATAGSLTVGTLSLTGDLTVGGRSVATEPLASDAIQYVSPNGNDSNDGLSWGTAKATVFAAYQALPNTGGVIYVSDQASCGGPNNTFWVVGDLGNDPQWNGGAGNPSAGWLPQKNGHVRIVGVTANQAVQNASPGGARLNCNPNLPQIWISGVGVFRGFYFENLYLSGNTTIVRLAVRSDGNFAAATAANNIRFVNCHLSTAPTGSGPTVYIDSNTFWVWFIGGGINAAAQAAVDSDAQMAMVLNPNGATGSDIGLIFLYDLNINGGGIHLYDDATSDPHGNMSFYASNVFFEGLCTTKGAIWVNDNGTAGTIYLDRIAAADSCAAHPNIPAVYVANNAKAGNVDHVIVSNSTGDAATSVIGPALVPNSIPHRETVNPLGRSQWGLFGWQVVAQTDAARRLFGPVAGRFQNLAPQNPANWCWTCSGQGLVNGTDYQLNVSDPAGGTYAARMINSSGMVQIARGNYSTSVGDYFIGGVWIRATGTGQGIAMDNSPEVVDIVVNGCSATKLPGPGIGHAAVKGDRDWHWVWNLVRITANGTGVCDMGLNVGSWNVGGFDAFGPVFIQVPASSGVTDEEAIAMALNLNSYGNGLPAGTVATLPRHPIALGGSGDDYFAILDHSALTSNQTYTLPASGGTICVTPNNSCGAITASSISLNNIYVLNGTNFATITGSNLTANPTLQLPSSSGTLCVSSAPCGIGTTVNWASVSIPANSCSAQQFTVNGANQGQAVVVSPPSDIGNLVWTAAITAANTLKINMCNPTTAAITSPAVTFTVRVLP